MNRILISSLIILVLGLTGCSSSTEQAAPEPSPGMKPADSGQTQAIRTVKVETRTIPDFVDIPARIQAEPTLVVRVYPPVAGRLISVSVNPGDHVSQGQTLAILESSDVSAARADYLKARTDADLKENSRKRASMLFENKVLAEKDYRQAAAEAEMAQADLVRVRDRLRVLGIEPEGSSNRLAVLAPRSGVVLDVGESPGELSKSVDSPAPLCTLADLSRVWAVGDIYEKDLQGLSPGSAAEVGFSAFDGERWKSSVAAISDVVDPSTRTLKVRIVLANPGWKLKPEMFGSIRLFRNPDRAIAIPAAAVLRDDTTTFVMVETSPGKYERRQVAVGRTLDQGIEVTSGLKPGESVVAEGAILLRGTTK
jgi:membrane fusion protein, heavy metal efflux system